MKHVPVLSKEMSIPDQALSLCNMQIDPAKYQRPEHAWLHFIFHWLLDYYMFALFQKLLYVCCYLHLLSLLN